MDNIKFRQPEFRNGKFHCWHYWGWMGPGDFVGPMGRKDSPSDGDQFTGEKDARGADVYEGDILYSGSFGVKLYWIVSFSDGSFRAGTRGQTYHSPIDKENLRYRAVMGNITENPEFLDTL